MAHDPRLPQVFTRRDALHGGLTPSQIKTRAHNGRWHVLRRGVYCLSSTWDACDRNGRHLLAVHAEAAGHETVWVSHGSAAALHGYPLPLGHDRVWMTKLPPARTQYGRGFVIEAATVPLADQWQRANLMVTSPRRTVADCLRHHHPMDSLAIADAASRSDPSMIEAVGRVLGTCADWPYAARAGAVLPLVDGRRESWLESASFWFMHAFKVPLPVPQVSIYDSYGNFLGRVDAWWEQFGVVGEIDGRSKYLPAGGNVEVTRQLIVDEKDRENLLRGTGADVIRWGASDIARPAFWAREVMPRLMASDPRRFRGRAVTMRPPA